MSADDDMTQMCWQYAVFLKNSSSFGIVNQLNLDFLTHGIVFLIESQLW